MKKVDHPHCVKLYEVIPSSPRVCDASANCHPHMFSTNCNSRRYEVIDDPSSRKTYMVIEFVDGGPVADEDRITPLTSFPVDVVRNYMRDTLLALDFLHREHRRLLNRRTL